MAATYHLHKIALTDGQKQKLQKAFAEKSAVTLRVKPEQIGRGDELLLTSTQIRRMKKAVSEKNGPRNVSFDWCASCHRLDRQNVWQRAAGRTSSTVAGSQRKRDTHKPSAFLRQLG